MEDVRGCAIYSTIYAGGTGGGEVVLGAGILQFSTGQKVCVRMEKDVPT